MHFIYFMLLLFIKHDCWFCFILSAKCKFLKNETNIETNNGKDLLV